MTRQSLCNLSLMISISGLTIWEAVQIIRPNGFFDPHDLLWSFVGGFVFLVVHRGTIKAWESSERKGN
jgi:hypothetical protein